jgi:hypothetical protein
MSNFSDFFPAAAGGGIGQTITVGDYSYPNAISIENFAKTKIRFVNTVQINTQVVSMPSSSSPGSYASTASANNTWANLANITSATNGGGIYFMGGHYQNSVNYAPQMYWRVTIDGGTPFEIGSPYIAGESQAWIMGASYEIANPIGNSTTWTSAQSILVNNGGGFSNISSGWSTNSYSPGEYYFQTGGNLQNSTIGVYTPELSATKGLPYIYFSSSCLIEYKVNEPSTFTSASAFATIKTF